MRMSSQFSQTLREAPAEAEVASHVLLLRAGFIRQLASGIFSYLPMARRTFDKIEKIIREEIDAIGGQEITMPVVHPADIWKETGRWYEIDAEMGRFCDRSNRDMVLAMTHEEVVADLVRKEIKSYRQLPQLVYHLQTKWRDDPRPRSGLLRVREFTMKDSYSLDADEEGLEKQYRAHYQAYFNIFNRCGIPTIAVKADVGMMGGKLAHEYIYLNEVGEDTIVRCPKCGYFANWQVAVFRKEPVTEEVPEKLERVATPDASTIEELSQFLGISESKTAKVVFVMGRFVGNDEQQVERLIVAVIRGDMEVNETKLANAVKALSLRPARDEEIRNCGAVPGYASPIGLENCLVVADDSVCEAANIVAGANEEGFHVRNVNYNRDYRAEVVDDIASAEEGASCQHCDGRLNLSRGVEVGNIFQLGTRYTSQMNCSFLDADGVAQPVIMGSYGIGVGRLLACVAQEHHDENGLTLPISIAPYQVHLVCLAKDKGPAQDVAERVYDQLQESGLEVLYDDRSESAGVKFNDADLIGLPLRITVGDRSIKKGVLEIKVRSETEVAEVAMDDVVDYTTERCAVLIRNVRERVVEVAYAS